MLNVLYRLYPALCLETEQREPLRGSLCKGEGILLGRRVCFFKLVPLCWVGRYKGARNGMQRRNAS